MLPRQLRRNFVAAYHLELQCVHPDPNELPQWKRSRASTETD